MSGGNPDFAALRAEFERRGFSGRVGFGVRPALLVVDLVNGFTDPASPLGSDLESVVAATGQLLVAARSADVPVIFSTVSYDRELQESGIWTRKIPAAGILVEGSAWVEIDRRLARRKREMLLVKKYASCFFGTDLAARLIARRIDTLLITGCSTSGCVRATTVDACSYGFHAIVVAEAVGDRAELPHLASLFDIDSKYGDVVGLPDALRYLGSLGVRS